LHDLTEQQNISTKDWQSQELQSYFDFMDNIIFLTKSWRFDAKSGIGHLSKAVNSGNFQATLDVLNANLNDIKWFPTTEESELLQTVMPHFQALHEASEDGDIAAAFQQLMQCQILTAQRTGKWGLEHINGLIKRALLKRGLIVADQEFYSGRPLMITSNDYQSRLFNGDVGVVIKNDEASRETGREVLNVWFQDAAKTSNEPYTNGVEAGSGFRSLLPAQLPAHDTMYAMTTHKSQGSEFSRVIFCLPQSDHGTGKYKSSEILNRELLYTGITRAKQQFILFADPYSVTNAVNQVCRRASGLASALARVDG
jgi:exodeoxyribonuclease V alpha subunit